MRRCQYWTWRRPSQNRGAFRDTTVNILRAKETSSHISNFRSRICSRDSTMWPPNINTYYIIKQTFGNWAFLILVVSVILTYHWLSDYAVKESPSYPNSLPLRLWKPDFWILLKHGPKITTLTICQNLHVLSFSFYFLPHTSFDNIVQVSQESVDFGW